MPVAKPVTMIIPNYLPHKDRNKRKITEETAKKSQELVIKHATVEQLEERIETTAEALDSLDNSVVTEAESSVEGNPCLNVIKSQSVKILSCEPEKPKVEQRCKKHSRCHCDLLSLETTDFFTIKV